MSETIAKQPLDLKKAGVNVATTFITVMSISMGIVLAMTFNFREITDFQIRRGLEPGYPYLQAITMTSVGDEQMFELLSKSVKSNSEIVDGINISEKLLSFGEELGLYNGSGTWIAGTKEKGRAMAIYAIPRGGFLMLFGSSQQQEARQ